MDKLLNLRKEEIALYQKGRRNAEITETQKLKDGGMVYKDNWELVTGWRYTENWEVGKNITKKYLNKYEYFRDMPIVRNKV